MLATKSASHMPPGFTAVTPYLTVEEPARLVDFAKAAFAAEEIRDQHLESSDGRLMHTAFRVEGCLIETGRADGQWKALPSGIHLYVRDADAAYSRGSQSGGSKPSRCARYGIWRTVWSCSRPGREPLVCCHLYGPVQEKGLAQELFSIAKLASWWSLSFAYGISEYVRVFVFVDRLDRIALPGPG